MTWKKDKERSNVVYLDDGFYVEIHCDNMNISLAKMHEETKRYQELIVNADDSTD